MTMEENNNEWTAEQLDPSNWQIIPIESIPEKIRALFMVKQRALYLRLVKGLQLREVSEQTGIQIREIQRLVARSRIQTKAGNMAEWLACIPHYRLQPYTRKTKTKSNFAGTMTQFLEHHQLDQYFLRLAIGKVKVEGKLVRGRYFEGMYQQFRKKCIDTGIDVDTEYPFSNYDKGREAVRNYVIKIRESNVIEDIRVTHGSKVAAMAASSGKGYKNLARKELPYEITQLDGHRLDSIIAVTERDGAGDDQYRILSRVWLILIIDKSSKAILGYSLSLSENYSAQDVMNCIKSAFTKWLPLTSPNKNPPYIEGAGLPGGTIPLCEGRLFNQLRLDNAFAHLSTWVHQRLMGAGVTEIILNKPAAPRQNAVVERVNQTLAEISAHQFLNTTGSDKDDVRRRNPEKAAKRLRVTYEILEQKIDVFIANYNATANNPLNGRSPLEYISYHLNQDHLPPIQIDEMAKISLHERDFRVTIRMNKKAGHPPSVKFKGALYTSDTLRIRGDLKDKTAYLRFDVNDVRYGTLFQSDGACLGVVNVEQRWSWHKHDLRTRQHILKLTHEKQMSSLHRDPVGAYAEYLETESKKSKKHRNKKLALQKSMKSDKKDIDVNCDVNESENSEISSDSYSHLEKRISFDNHTFD